MDYISFSSYNQQSNTSQGERNENLGNYYTQLWIEMMIVKQKP